MSLVIALLAVLTVVATVLPLRWSRAWWIRAFDFPRVQLAGTAFVLLAAWPYGGPRGVPGLLLAVALGAALIFQLWHIRAYTPLHPSQTREAKKGFSGRLRVLVSNVLQSNRNAEALRDLVAREDPDLLLAVETDQWWEDRLRPLEQTLPHTIKVPQDNTYGMLLYSRYPLRDSEVRYLLDDEVPSITTRIEVPESPPITVFCLHPRPPRPEQDTTDRDAELVTVAREARSTDGPVVVAGDLNDVAWSYTTTLFQKISGLLDPRVGRGLYNTYHARIPLLRFPVDHVFHSDHFHLVRLQRLGYVGSDHFPVLFELAFESQARAEQKAPDADAGDHARARAIEAEARSQ